MPSYPVLEVYVPVSIYSATKTTTSILPTVTASTIIPNYDNTNATEATVLELVDDFPLV